jgi:hypothetical protein
MARGTYRIIHHIAGGSPDAGTGASAGTTAGHPFNPRSDLDAVRLVADCDTCLFLREKLIFMEGDARQIPTLWFLVGV